MPDHRSSKSPAAVAPFPIRPRFEFSLSANGRRLVWLRVAGEVDLATAPDLELSLRRAERHAQLVVLNLLEVTFMDSFGVHLIIDACRRASAHDRRIVALVERSSQVHRLMMLTCLDQLLEIIDDPDGLDAGAGRALHLVGSQDAEAPSPPPSP